MAVAAERWRTRAVAMEAAQAGGRAALRHFRRADLAVEWKADESPVTRADRESEAAARAVIAAAFPEDGWLGEETGEATRLDGGPGGSVRRWIVDPIDGTRNFVRGIPLWSTLVACEADGPAGPEVIASAVALPALDELYDAVKGGGARCNGTPIRVSDVAALDGALFCYETPAWFQKFGLERVFAELCQRSALQRGGGDAFFHMLVASGRAEVVVEPALKVWDVAATSLIVTEAGGRFSDLAGTPSIRSDNAVVTNGRLHNEVIALIHRCR